ncbi:histidine kinase [Palleronia sediminis]|uniref:Histidine kinase n=1 Tax=Palleronia sediminis TaxID=2547833 RepID=A0A4R6A7Q0_9RHOB|nr:DUF6446 family protein [Palleronia sediminis]TDL79801.1 histidine kinase [Palleronia sediminis]
MIARIAIVVVLVGSVLAGAGMYYLQVFHWYERVEPRDILLTARGGEEVPLPVSNIEAIDAESSPLRFRACFDTTAEPRALTDSFTLYEGAEPLTAPFWFDCYDASAIAADLSEGRAQAFLGIKNVGYGVDRIVAVTEGGRGYVWHQLNDCGELAYDGTQVGEDCPPREDFE